MKSLKLMYYFLSLLLFSSLTFAAPAPTPTDPTKPIYVKAELPTFEILLPANPTTGFSWFIKDYNSQLITPESAVFIPPKDSIPGRGGMMRWTFHANSAAFAVPTMTTIQLVYTQPWAQQSTKTQIFTAYTSM